jgi:hypothetical protein
VVYKRGEWDRKVKSGIEKDRPRSGSEHCEQCSNPNLTLIHYVRGSGSAKPSIEVRVQGHSEPEHWALNLNIFLHRALNSSLCQWIINYFSSPTSTVIIIHKYMPDRSLLKMGKVSVFSQHVVG